MICPNPQCAKSISEHVNFCPSCGTRLGAVPEQGISNTGDAGRDIHQYQAGRDFHFYPQGGGAPSTITPEYKVKWSWKSPLTLAALTWISVIVGVLSLGSVYQAFEPLVSALASGAGLAGAKSMQPVWLFALIGLLLVFVVAMVLRRVAKSETQHLSPLSMFPAITGWGGRIGLARLIGKCHCGGPLRFYAKAVGHSSPHPQTGKQVVTEREMVAECVHDSKHHVWRIGATDPH